MISVAPCATCGGHHPGRACYRQTRACFLCGSMDHRAKGCPCNNGDGGSGNGGQHNQQNPIGRVFALTSCQAATNPGTVSGTHDSYVLFDTGSTHSVVSLLYVRYLDVLPSLLSPHMSIATPMGTSVIISDVIESF